MSAVNAGVKDVREVVERAKNRLGERGQGTILFLDEVHRFNKTQQDALLPHVEDGLLVLVGATTENPYFSLTSAAAQPLDAVPARAARARRTSARSMRARARRPDPRARRRRPRRSTTTRSTTSRTAPRATPGTRSRASRSPAALAAEAGAPTITLEYAEAALAMRALRYGDDEHYDVVSAFIKSIRGSDVDAGLYWLARMLEAGEDARFIARRLVILASRGRRHGRPAWRCRRHRGRAGGRVRRAARGAAQPGPRRRVPGHRAEVEQHARSRSAPRWPTSATGRPGRFRPICGIRTTPGPQHLGHGEGYVYPHDTPEGWVPQEYRPARSPSRCTTGPTGRGRRRRPPARASGRRTQRAGEMPMSAGDWLAATGAVLLAVMLGGLLFALGSVVVTLRDLRGDGRARCRTQSIALADEMRIALRDAENEVDRVDALLDRGRDRRRPDRHRVAHRVEDRDEPGRQGARARHRHQAGGPPHARRRRAGGAR